MDNGVPKCCAKGELCSVLGVGDKSLHVLQTLTMELICFAAQSTAAKLQAEELHLTAPPQWCRLPADRLDVYGRCCDQRKYCWAAEVTPLAAQLPDAVGRSKPGHMNSREAGRFALLLCIACAAPDRSF